MLHITLIVIVSMITLSGCVDKCAEVNCLNGGTCEDGRCTCPNGFEGENCDRRERDKFVRRFNVTYRGRLVDGNQFSPNVIYNIDSTVSVNLAADVTTNGVVIPNWLMRSGQNMVCEVSGALLKPTTGIYQVEPVPGVTYTFNLISLGYWNWDNGNSMEIRIQNANIAANTQLDLRVILTPR